EADAVRLERKNSCACREDAADVSHPVDEPTAEDLGSEIAACAVGSFGERALLDVGHPVTAAGEHRPDQRSDANIAEVAVVDAVACGPVEATALLGPLLHRLTAREADGLAVGSLAGLAVATCGRCAACERVGAGRVNPVAR